MLLNKNILELLSPVQNLMFGIEAVLHGADAVYIGESKFEACARMGNSMADIKFYYVLYIKIDNVYWSNYFIK